MPIPEIVPSKIKRGAMSIISNMCNVYKTYTQQENIMLALSVIYSIKE